MSENEKLETRKTETQTSMNFQFMKQYTTRESLEEVWGQKPVSAFKNLLGVHLVLWIQGIYLSQCRETSSEVAGPPYP